MALSWNRVEEISGKRKRAAADDVLDLPTYVGDESQAEMRLPLPTDVGASRERFYASSFAVAERANCATPASPEIIAATMEPSMSRPI